jgi:hypothetical protein
MFVGLKGPLVGGRLAFTQQLLLMIESFEDWPRIDEFELARSGGASHYIGALKPRADDRSLKYSG